MSSASRSSDPAGSPDPAGLRAWNIDPGFHDARGTWQAPSAEAVDRLRRAMGARTADLAETPPPGTPLVVLRPGEIMTITEAPTDLVLEDGTSLVIEHGTPPDLPLGYHHLVQETRSGPAVTNLIVSPGRASLPGDLHTWGITAQLYAARSSRSWGMGDLGDLRQLVSWATQHGAGVVGLNPLHAQSPLPDQPPSPYAPSSRRWRDPLYLAIDDVPGAEHLPDRDHLIAQGRALNGGDRIDRSAIWALKRTALAELWTGFSGDPAFDRYRAEMGPELEQWAVHCALVDHHGGSWPGWPARHRHPDSPAVGRFATEHQDAVAFWAWLQWLLDVQLARSGAPETVVADVAVGFDAEGADAWAWQDLLAHGVHIGAPPDLLGPDGQDWGLPPFVPHLLRDQAYRPLASTLRAVARHARGLRIDHVMGLFRLFWVPPGMTAADGAYVRSAGRELLDVVALESARSDTFVVGEDLGTVEPGVREVLADAGVLSTRLLWFEDEPPSRWPSQAMAAVTTHDLPTTAGVWSGVDLADQRRAGVTVPDDGDDSLRERLRVAAGVDDTVPTASVVIEAHRRLADAPSMLVTAALDDLVGAEHRPNIPGTIDEHPNWRIPLPVPLDDLPGHHLAETVAAVLDRAVTPG